MATERKCRLCPNTICNLPVEPTPEDCILCFSHTSIIHINRLVDKLENTNIPLRDAYAIYSLMEHMKTVSKNFEDFMDKNYPEATSRSKALYILITERSREAFLA